MSREIRQQAAIEAANVFINNISLLGQEKIALYYSINNELDCLPLLEKLRANGHEICLPVIEHKNSPMVFRLWQKDEKLIEGEYNIKVPNENSPNIEPGVIIMPLVAYDENGNRLGYGKGYYDRTIAKMKNKPLLIGYAYEMQKVKNIASESHDVPLDYLVSEKQVRRF